jgi:hypothetical protein
MPAPDLIVGKLRCAHLPAELAPVLADLAHPPTVTLGLQPELRPTFAIALREAAAGIAGDDDPAVLAADHLITTNPSPGRRQACAKAERTAPALLSITGAADDPRP